MNNNNSNNHKLLNLYLNAKKNFSLYIYNIAISSAWFFTTIDNIRISVILQELGRLINTISLRNRIISILQALLNSFSTIYIKSMIISVLQELKRAQTTILIRSHVIPIFKEKYRLFSTVNVTRPVIISTSSLATLYKLSVYDPQTLATLDVLTLDQMDKT